MVKDLEEYAAKKLNEACEAGEESEVIRYWAGYLDGVRRATHGSQDDLSRDPLTLERLREMDGQPVWVENLENPEKSEWRLLYWDRVKYLVPLSKSISGYILEEYGKTWVAYAYSPVHIDREAFCGSWEGEGDGYANGELVYDVWRCGCGHVEETDDPDLLPDFCPDCGLAMTQKAREILEKRLRG